MKATSDPLPTQRAKNPARCFSPGLRTGLDSVERMRFCIAIIISCIGLLLAVVIGIFNLSKHKIVSGGIDFAVATGLAAGLISLKMRFRRQTWYLYSHCLLAAFFMYTVQSSGLEPHTAVLIFFLALLSLHTTGILCNISVPATVSFSVILLFFFFGLPHSTGYFKLHITAVFSLVTIGSHLFAGMRPRLLHPPPTAFNSSLELHNESGAATVSFEQLFEILPCAIITLKPDGSIAYLNAEAERLTGYATNEVLGKSDDIWIIAHAAGPPPSDPEQSHHQVPESMVCRMRRSDDTILTILRSTVPMTDNNGNITGTIEMYFDMTGWNEQNSESAATATKPERAHTDTVEFPDIEHVLQMTISHEIRPALNHLIGITSLILNTTLNSMQQEYADNLRTTSEKLIATINDVLDYTCFNMDDFKLEQKDFDLHDCIDDAVETATAAASSKEIEIQALIHDTVPLHCKGDPSRLKQVITTIAAISVRLAGSGEVIVSASKVADNEEQVTIRFEISCTGKELGAQTLPDLFAPFSQTASAASHGQTGLSIALSRLLIAAMGGETGLKRISGNESTIWFTIGLTTSPAPKTADSIPADSRPLDGMRLLVIGMSPLERRVVTFYLANTGCICSIHDSYPETAGILNDRELQPQKHHAILAAMHHESEGAPTQFLHLAINAQLNFLPLVIIAAQPGSGEVDLTGKTGITTLLKNPIRRSQLINCLSKIHCNEHKQISTSTQSTTNNSYVPDSRTSPPTEDISTGERILVAEDNTVNRKIVEKFLEKAGYSCDFAENGTEAVAMFEKRGYDLIFMDCMMPQMSGYDATRSIRKYELLNKSKSRVIICAFTASTSDDERQICMECGMDDIIYKPLSWKTFETTLNKWIQAPKA